MVNGLALGGRSLVVGGVLRLVFCSLVVDCCAVLWLLLLFWCVVRWMCLLEFRCVLIVVRWLLLCIVCVCSTSFVVRFGYCWWSFVVCC